MPSAPFNIDLVVARIKATVPALQQVRGAAEYAAISEFSDFRPPEGFVLLARERGKPMPGTTRQPVQVFFGVVVAVRNYRQQRGKPAMDEALPLIGQVRDALIGWIPQDGAGAQVGGGRGCQWLQGDVMDYDNSTLLWSDVFQTQHFIGSTQ